MSETTERDRTLATEVYNAATVLRVAIDAARKAGLQVVMDRQPYTLPDGVTCSMLMVHVSRVTTIDFAPNSPEAT